MLRDTTMPRATTLLRAVRRLMIATAVVGLVNLPTSATACPKCKEALVAQSNGQGLQRGFQYSILFMLAAPFGILTGLGSYFWWEVRRARRNLPTPDGGSASPAAPGETAGE